MIVEGKSGLTLNCPALRPLELDQPLVTLRDCTDVTIIGDWTGAGAGRAIEIMGCERVKIEAQFSRWHRGLLIDCSRHVDVRRSRFANMRSDGVNVRESEDITIEGNEFRDFAPVGDDHGDAIWVATGLAPHPFGPSRRVRIAGNLIDAAKCNSIFVASPNRERHSGIVIERNVVLSGSPNGIFLSYADDSAIRDNKVLGPGQHIRLFESAPELVRNVAREWQIDGKWQAKAPAGNERGNPDPAPFVADWQKQRDPRWSERDGLRVSIPADTAKRDAITRQLAKDRARLRALDKALGA